MAAIERCLFPPKIELQGSIELHVLKGWPPVRDDPTSSFQPCSEHGPACAVSITRIAGRLRRVVLLDSSDAVPLG
jgi:hypothetical protein